MKTLAKLSSFGYNNSVENAKEKETNTMAQKKRKSGKIEAQQLRPAVRFKPGVLLCIIAAAFLFCFVMYMISAVSEDDYWEKEIVPSLAVQTEENVEKKTKADVTNPVPASERADDSRIENCAFIGDVETFTNYYPVSSTMQFTDAITEMSDSRMRSIGRSLKEAQAIYIWYQCPDDLPKSADAFLRLVNNLLEQSEGVPIYVLTAFPSTDAVNNQRTDTWNSAIFSLCDQKGLHYVDVSTTLKANDGTLSENYQDEEVLYQTVYELILTHIAD